MAAQQYPLELPYVRLTIGGTDRTDEMIGRTARVKQILGAQVDTCSFSLKPKESYRGTAGTRPTNGVPVLVEVATGSGDYEKKFGGLISRVKQRKIAYKTYAWDVQAVDYSALAGKILVNDTYVGRTVSQIANAIVRDYVPYVSTSGIQSMPTVIDRITFARQYPNQCLDHLAKISGYEWYVNADKVLHFFDPITQAPMSVLEVTDSSNNFEDLSIEPRVDQVRNRIYVQGGLALSDEIEEVHDSGGTKDVFVLAHQGIFADLKPAVSGLDRSRFMTVDGEMQVVGLAGIVNDSPTVDFILDPAAGVVASSSWRATVPDGKRIIFRYRYQVPINSVKEDRDSQQAIAEAEGNDYQTVVTSKGPTHWWRLDESTGKHVANTAWTAGSGILAGNYGPDYELRASGPLTGRQGYGIDFHGSGRIQCFSGTVMPQSAYTIEAWVNPTTTPVEQGILGQWDDRINSGGERGRGAAILASGGVYHLRHLSLAFSSNRPVTGGAAYDHVVATWNGNDFRMYVNKQPATIAPTSTTLDLPTVSGIEIANINYDYTTRRLIGRVAEAAIYPRALTAIEVAENYDAGRFGGVREAVVVDNTITSFEDADRHATRQLLQWGNPLTDINLKSYVPGWNIGEQLKVQVSGLGITFSGAALIQDVDMQWVGGQRVLYSVHCVGARFNLIDYYRALGRTRDVVSDQASILNYVRPVGIGAGAVILVGGTASSQHLAPPFYLQPDWGTGTTPAAVAGFFVTDSSGQGNPWF